MNTSQVVHTAILSEQVRRPTAVSQVLRALKDVVEQEPVGWMPVPGADAFPGRVLVANTVSIRRRAWQLAYRVYSECGYVERTPHGMVTSSYDQDPSTFILLVEDESGQAMATVTLVFDTQKRLPCDEIFHQELEALRAQGRRVAEVTRLAIDERHTGSKSLLVALFNFIFVSARRVRNYDDFVIEVNPRHVNYYKRLLKFDIVGSERPCPRVNDAPAVLLRVDLGMGVNEVLRVGGQGKASKDRTLYSFFLPWVDHCPIYKYLSSQERRPMHGI